MPSIFKVINLQKKKIETSKRTSLLTFPHLTHLVRSNNFLSTKLTKKIRITKEVFAAMVDKNKIEPKTSLQYVFTLLPKKKKRTFLISNNSSAKEKFIILINVFKRKIIC